MLANIILWATGLIFTAYGLACFFDPSLAANYAGLAITNTDARIEMSAMYGGVQIAVGVFSVMAALNKVPRAAALLLLTLVFGGLVIGRAYGLLNGSEGAGVYTYGALAFELISGTLALIAWRSYKP